MKTYRTLLADASAEYVIQKSRFIGHAAPVSSEEAALAFLENVRREHRTANHNCFAYVIGSNAGVMRYSDDGEPGGTAGLPMMNVLQARGTVDCAVVVTRYFGGVLLGTGGLTRAYSHTCALAVAAAGVCEMSPTYQWQLEVDYPLWDKTQHALKELPARLETPVFEEAVRFAVLCRQTDAQRVWNELLLATDGRIRRLAEEELYIAWVDKPGSEA